jgi:hypothetical protein
VIDQGWICGACRSVNQPVHARCYHCHAPRVVAQVDPATLPVSGTVPEVAEAPLPLYHSSQLLSVASRSLALLASAAVLLGGIVAAIMIDALVEEGTGAALGPRSVLDVIAVAQLALVLGALIAWSAWLSRVVANVPAVGLGYPSATPRSAFLENFIPVVNLLRVPSIVRDVTRRLDPTGRGEALMVAAWIGLVGGTAVPAVLEWTLAQLNLLVPLDILAVLRITSLASQVGVGLQVAGTVFLVLLIGWVEGRMSQRAAGLSG